MTLADQTAMTTRQDGRVTDEQRSDQPGGPSGPSGQPARPKRRTFTKDYKARILAAYDALPEGSPERGALLRAERLYHSHLEHWRKERDKGALPVPAAKPKQNTRDNAENEELARLRAENKKLRAEAAKLEARNEKLSGDLDKTQTALDIAGKAFALLQGISSSADSEQSCPASAPKPSRPGPGRPAGRTNDHPTPRHDVHIVGRTDPTRRDKTKKSTTPRPRRTG